MIENILFKLSIMLVPGLLAITCHEVSHGYVAWRYGDPTAKMLGRLTLNPLKHIDILGTLMLVIVGIGWAKPVPVVIENLRNPKKDMIWVSIAGPVTNILLALASALLLRAVLLVPPDVGISFVLRPVSYMAAFSVYINLLLAFFNMIPIPPLDGGRVLMGLLPYRQATSLSRLEPYGMIIIILLVFFTPFFSIVLRPLIDYFSHLLIGTQTLSSHTFRIM
ncbi:MAG: site-2 protease family protein [Geobacteraceae bacterium]|nr:site-2 protease family protein [Geobacteraceae bacterium]